MRLTSSRICVTVNNADTKEMYCWSTLSLRSLCYIHIQPHTWSRCWLDCFLISMFESVPSKRLLVLLVVVDLVVPEEGLFACQYIYMSSCAKDMLPCHRLPRSSSWYGCSGTRTRASLREGSRAPRGLRAPSEHPT